MENTKKAKLFSHFLDVFKKHAMNTISSLLYKAARAKFPEALSHHLPIVIMKSEFIMSGFIPSLK